MRYTAPLGLLLCPGVSARLPLRRKNREKMKTCRKVCNKLGELWLSSTLSGFAAKSSAEAVEERILFFVHSWIFLFATRNGAEKFH